MREPCGVIVAHDRLRDMAVQILGRADLLLAAGSAFVERHVELDLEWRQLLVLQLEREGTTPLWLGRKFLAAGAAEVLLEQHPFLLAGDDLAFPGAQFLNQPEHEVAMHRHPVILRAGEERHLEQGELERPIQRVDRWQRLEFAGADTLHATRNLQCHGSLLPLRYSASVAPGSPDSPAWTRPA